MNDIIKLVYIHLTSGKYNQSHLKQFFDPEPLTTNEIIEAIHFEMKYLYKGE